MLRRLRELQREHGGARCAERAAADIAEKRLTGNGSASTTCSSAWPWPPRASCPSDKVGAAEAGLKIARQMLKRGQAAGRRRRPCRRRQAVLRRLRAAAGPRRLARRRTTWPRGFGVGSPRRATPAAAATRRGARTHANYASDERVLTACPACDAGLREAELDDAAPLERADRARRSRTGRSLKAAAERFVPYVGCLSRARRGAELARRRPPRWPAPRCELTYPSLHAGCCGALGGMYRGATEAVHEAPRLRQRARTRPSSPPCLLCRDNVRSAARKAGATSPSTSGPSSSRRPRPPLGPRLPRRPHDREEREQGQEGRRDRHEGRRNGRACRLDTRRPLRGQPLRGARAERVRRAPVGPGRPDAADHRRPAHARPPRRLRAASSAASAPPAARRRASPTTRHARSPAAPSTATRHCSTTTPSGTASTATPARAAARATTAWR